MDAIGSARTRISVEPFQHHDDYMLQSVVKAVKEHWGFSAPLFSITA